MFNHFRSEITSLELVPSSRGAFEVTVDGEKIYSKLDTGRFPKIEQVIKKIEK